MNPPTNDHATQPDSRAWWLPTISTADKLVHFYNTNITPITMFMSIRKLTRPTLKEILLHPSGPQYVEENNHITTHNCCMNIRTSDRVHFILCPSCCMLTRRQGSALNNPTTLPGGNHAVFGRNNISILLQIKRLWCAKCKRMLFTWTSTEECLNYHTFHNLV